MIPESKLIPQINTFLWSCYYETKAIGHCTPSQFKDISYCGTLTFIALETGILEKFGKSSRWPMENGEPNIPILAQQLYDGVAEVEAARQLERKALKLVDELAQAGSGAMSIPLDPDTDSKRLIRIETKVHAMSETLDAIYDQLLDIKTAPDIKTG